MSKEQEVLNKYELAELEANRIAFISYVKNVCPQYDVYHQGNLMLSHPYFIKTFDRFAYLNTFMYCLNMKSCIKRPNMNEVLKLLLKLNKL